MTTDATLAADIDATCRLTGEFTLRSGQVADTYFDKYLFEAQPALLDRVAAQMVDLLPEDTELLGGLELGGIPIATMVSAKTGLPALFVRKKAKEYGTAKLAEGPDVAGRRVTIIEDVITTGGAVRDATRALRELGAIVEVVVCAIDRSPAGENPLADVGLEVRSVLTRADLDAASRCGSTPARRQSTSRPVMSRSGPPSCWPISAPAAWVRLWRHHSMAIGITENARMTMISLSMLSPSVGNASPRKKPSRQIDDDPQHRADEAPEEEPVPLHPGHAGDHGDVGPHERHEAADHERLVAVAVEERGGLVEVLALDDPAVALVERWPDLAPDLVADDVAEEGGDDERRHRDEQLDEGRAREEVELAGGDEEADARRGACRRAGSGRTARTRRR